MKKLLIALFLTALILPCFACTNASTPEVKVKAVTCSYSEEKIVVEDTFSGKQVVLTANVMPKTATNQKVDFTYSWQVGSERSEESVGDYIGLHQAEDGSQVATIMAKKPFGNDVILVQVKTRDGGFTDVCKITSTVLIENFGLTTYAVALDENDVQVVSGIINPETANNKTVNFRVTWKTGAEAIEQGLNVEDYVELSAGPDVSSVSIKCLQAFKDDILLLATTEDGKFTSSAVISYAKKINTLTLSCDSLELVKDDVKGDHYVLIPGENYAFNILTDNEEAITDYSIIKVGVTGTYYAFCTYYQTGANGMPYEYKYYTDLELDSSTLISAELAEDKVNSSVVLNFTRYALTPSGTQSVYTNFDILLPEQVKSYISEEDSVVSQNTFENGWVDITVKENYSGLTQTFRVYIGV